MLLFRKLKTFLTLPGSIKWLLFKALVISLFVKITLVFRPFKKVLNWLGEVNVESSVSPDPESLVTRTEIKTALALCNKYSIWKTECYTLSLTAKLLLKKYKLPSTIYIGFYKNEEGKYLGHAWLRSYDMIITGAREMEKFTVQSIFT